MVKIEPTCIPRNLLEPLWVTFVELKLRWMRGWSDLGRLWGEPQCFRGGRHDLQLLNGFEHNGAEHHAMLFDFAMCL